MTTVRPGETPAHRDRRVCVMVAVARTDELPLAGFLDGSTRRRFLDRPYLYQSPPSSMRRGRAQHVEGATAQLRHAIAVGLVQAVAGPS
ncbi:hypothetical protein ACFYO2_24330 [Streptomyces sp. NPDC006602]|uniref:hypothetical protein n=1 Tax=Streptomyces sp. NPDC006602 TaxID=3364751 RepID=UPI00368C4910